MISLQRKDRSTLPEKQQISKYYEMDGALRAYANRMAVLGLTCGLLALLALGLFAYVRLQPPVVIRVDYLTTARVFPISYMWKILISTVVRGKARHRKNAP